MLGSRTRGGRMEGADKSTELWRHPWQRTLQLESVYNICKCFSMKQNDTDMNLPTFTKDLILTKFEGATTTTTTTMCPFYNTQVRGFDCIPLGL